jgi:hypothetical protein
MRTVFEVEPEKLLVSVSDAINTLQPRSDSPAAPQVRLLIDQARQVFAESAHPRGVYQTITLTDFEQVYRGEGENDENTPVEQVIEEAVELALFVVTLGGEVSQHIEDFFAAGNAADGYILDQVASYAADELAQIAGHRFRESKPGKDGTAVLPYSPGYCGWNVSGQPALFAHLEPAEIGITLNASCLMHPLKSVSGVLVVAPVEAHSFSPSFPCCASCTTLACQDRIATIGGAPDRPDSD